ncbi:hypothetical protein L484_022784 [Morus notabilis]|uniref:Uncharacterized protein n=1 Tax=Morus notabilis TaxID=981085 RepID=W9STU6_9ROSA|nr:hypothetical protein L484_022784 [Morus notabilis]
MPKTRRPLPLSQVSATTMEGEVRQSSAQVSTRSRFFPSTSSYDFYPRRLPKRSISTPDVLRLERRPGGRR